MKMKMIIRTMKLALLVVILAGINLSAGDKPWIDMERCAMCQAVKQHDGLMQNMTMETHEIGNGIVSVRTVNDSHMAAFRRADAAMDELGKKAMAGQPVELCNMCQSMFSLMKDGARHEKAETMHGKICVITSDNPQTVEKIKDWSRRTNKEMATMMAKATDGKQKH